MLHADALAEMTPARARLYEFLSAAYRYAPTDDDLARLEQWDQEDALPALFGLDAGVAFRDWMRSFSTIPAVTAEIKKDFMALFKVPGNRYVAPYESVYCENRKDDGKPAGLLMGPPSVDVKKWYALAAVEMDKTCRELPDHIAIELGFMAWLCEKQQQFWKAHDERLHRRACEMQRDFLAAHILPWVGSLTRRIVENASLPYYPAVAELTAAFAEADMTLLVAILGPSEKHATPRYAPWHTPSA